MCRLFLESHAARRPAAASAGGGRHLRGKGGYEIRASRSKISRMETGRVGLKVRDVEDLLTLYGVADERERAKVITLARRSREPEWWTQYHDILPD